jgi:PAS domain S-box-containing protein
LHPDDREHTLNEIQYFIKEKLPLDMEFRILWPDKTVHWILSKGHMYYDREDNAEKMIGVNIDITERKRAVEALQESERRFHTMSDHAPVMIWMSDAYKQCNFLNKTWLLFTGKTMETEVGDGWLEDIHPDDRSMFMNIFNDANTRREEFKIDYRLKRYDGEYRWIMNHGIPRYAGNEGSQIFIGYIGTCIDISERIDLERQKDDFMSIASHELKTPVTSIKAYAQILQQKFSKMDDAQSAGMLTRLDIQIDKLTELINTLLDVAKIQSGQMEYDREVIDVNEIIKELKEEYQPTYPSHQIVTSLDASARILGDKARITQVLSNFISNAIKYSSDHHEIVVRSENNRGDVVIAVEDFGVGIPLEMQDKIFGRFFRVSEVSGNRVSGLGLGLYIASQIIHQQGGKVWLKSLPGKGSTFYFSLPAYGAS